MIFFPKGALLSASSRVVALCLVGIAGALFGCSSPSDGTAVHPAALTPSTLDPSLVDSLGEGVRLALAQVEGRLPEVSYDALLHTGAITAGPRAEKEVTRNLRDNLIGRVKIASVVGYGEKASIRRDTWQLGATFSPKVITGGDKRLVWPLTMDGGSKIDVVRVFPTKEAANTAPAFSLWDLPLTAEAARKLAPGTMVTFPMTGTVALRASGSFLQKTLALSTEFGSWVRGSATGMTGGTAQGMLMAEGSHALQIIRLDGSLVRLRVVSKESLSAEGSVRFSAQGKLRYVFLPFTKTERARELVRSWASLPRNAANTFLNPIANARTRFDELTAGLSPEGARLLSLVPRLPPDGTQLAVERDGAPSIDPVLEAVRAGRANLDALETTIRNKTNAALTAFEGPYARDVGNPLASIESLSDHTLRLDAAVEVSGKIKEAIHEVVDYIFSLDVPEAVHAMDRALGRTAWLGGDAPNLRLNLGRKLLSDFTLADTLAIQDVGSNAPRVRRVATALGELRTSHWGMTFSGLFMKTGFEENITENTVRVTDSEGNVTSWVANLWEFSEENAILDARESESLRSGAFVPSGDSQGGTTPVYWFGWSRKFSPYESSPNREALRTVINELGPRALDLGIPTLYQGEFPGSVRAELTLAIPGPSFMALFDDTLTTENVLWKALGDVASTFDNRYGLPYVATPFRPEASLVTQEAKDACESVAKHWGGSYCFAFANEFLPAWKKATKADARGRVDFLASLYHAGFLANKIGSRLLVRYLAEVLRQIHRDDPINVRFAIDNGQNDSLAASPRFSKGDGAALDLATSMVGAR